MTRLAHATTVRIWDHSSSQKGAIRLIDAGVSVVLTDFDQRKLAAVLERAASYGANETTRQLILKEDLRPGVCWRVKPYELLGRRLLTVTYEVQGHPALTLDQELAEAIAGAVELGSRSNGPTGVQ